MDEQQELKEKLTALLKECDDKIKVMTEIANSLTAKKKEIEKELQTIEEKHLLDGLKEKLESLADQISNEFDQGFSRIR